MRWIVERVCDGGIKVGKHLRWARKVRGRVSVGLEVDPLRRRSALVARVIDLRPEEVVLPLFDVTLLPTLDGTWKLAGYEHHLGGALARDQIVGQTWLLTPADEFDLARAESRAQSLEQDLYDLKLKMGRLPGVTP